MIDLSEKFTDSKDITCKEIACDDIACHIDFALPQLCFILGLQSMEQTMAMKAIGKHFSKVAEQAYARHGVAWAGLLSDWQIIIGQPLSDICLPEKISWPRQQSETRSKHQKIGGTLVMKVAYGRALEVQHTTPQIIDKINAYYGYQAISQIKIIQGDIPKPEIFQKPELRPLGRAAAARLDSEMVEIEDDNLKGALRNLAKGVLTKKSGG